MAKGGDDKEPAAKGGAKKLIVLVLAGLLLMGAGVVGSLYFTGMLGGGGSGSSEEKSAEDEVEASTVPIYFAFADPFIVNFETESGLRFLQVSMELMSYQPVAIDAVQTHLPVIKNNLLLMFSSQTYETLVTTQGKDEVRRLAINEIQSILDKYEEGAKLEEVYFTNFVMQ